MATLPVQIGGQVAAPAKVMEWGISEVSCGVGQYCTVLVDFLHIEKIGQSVLIPPPFEPMTLAYIAGDVSIVDEVMLPLQYKRFVLIEAIPLSNLGGDNDEEALRRLNDGLGFNRLKVERVWLREA
jgi:hypothetical protein